MNPGFKVLLGVELVSEKREVASIYIKPAEGFRRHSKVLCDMC